MTIYNYGEYERLFRNKNLKKAFHIINRISKKLKIGYFIVGGSAVYLHIKNPPVDYPDIDIMLDTDKKRAEDFAFELRKNDFRIISFEPSWEDAFIRAEFKNLGFEIFTSQEERKYLWKPHIIKQLKVKPIEGLIIEKLIRESYPDTLMAIDLLASKKYNFNMLILLAKRYTGLTNKLLRLKWIADVYVKGIISKKKLQKYVKKISGRSSLDHC